MRGTRLGFWLGLAVVAVVVGLLARPGRTDGLALDPRSTSPTGTKAMSELLAAYTAGVSLDPFDGETTVIVVVEDPFDAGLTGRFERFVRQGGRAIVLDPGSELGALSVDVADNVRSIGRCSIPRIDDLETVSGEFLVEFDATASERSCFGDESGTAFVVESSLGLGQVVNVGGASPFDNEHLASDDNAALIVRLVGEDRGERVALVHPATLPTGADGGGDTLVGLIPPRVEVALAQLVIAALLWLWFRGRRFGRVVSEPVLVEIPASLLVRSSAELHRRAGNHQWAADRLRADFARRLRREHRLGPELDEATTAELVARRTGAPAPLLFALLVGGPVTGPADLASVVTQIDDLTPLLFADALSGETNRHPTDPRSSLS